MKKTMIFIFSLVFVSLLRADIDFESLQKLTNQIDIAYGKVMIMKSDLTTYLDVLASKSNVEGIKPSEKAIREAICLTNAYAVTKHLEQMPPAKALPLYVSLMENDSLIDRQIVLFDGSYTNTFSSFLNGKIHTKLDINAYSGFKKTPTMLWLPKSMPMTQIQMALFWYYIGRKYLPVLWEDWYKCWKLENQLEKPRFEVLEKLAKDLNYEFGYHVYPFIAEAIRQGDDTFQPLIDVLPKFGGYTGFGWSLDLDKSYGFVDSKTFLTWWDHNKDNFIIPDGKNINDVKNIFYRKNPADCLGPDTYKRYLQLGKILDEYCKQEERPLTNCWYFTMKEGDEKNWR